MNPGKNIRLFKNPLFEWFTYVHPILPIAFWGPLVVYWFASGIYSEEVAWAPSIGLALLGLAVWSISEYLLHRYIFHFKPFGPITRRLVYLFHGVHHDDPDDARRLLMPPAAGIAIATVFYTIFSIVLGPVHVKPFFAGFIVGYLCYDYIHFAVHFMRPKSKLMIALKHNHMKHHFVTPDRRFGVSGTFWDHVFGTRS